MKYITLMTALLFALTSCQTNKEIIPAKPSDQVYNKEKSKGLQEGSIDVFKMTVRSEEPNKNVIISPLSIQYAFGMAANGASGETKEQILKLMGSNAGTLGDINNNLKAIQDKISGQDKDYSVSVSNGIFYDGSKFSISDTYEKVVKDMYRVSIKKLDFNKVDQSVKTINDWVSANTQQRITKVLDNINQEEFMFLINTLYMKAGWDKPFVPEMTHDSKFTTSTKVEKEVPMMSQRGNIASYTTDDESAIVMPMSNGRLEALFIMPNKTDIYNYVSSITASKIDRMYNEAKVGDIQISLPKVEMKMHYDLKNILQKMGITDPFNERAKFETMGTASGKILLTRAIHDVFMKVDEKGMEGAAVTTIGVGTTSMPPSIYFDRPYMMVVRDRATGTYLFMGKIEDPTK